MPNPTEDLRASPKGHGLYSLRRVSGAAPARFRAEYALGAIAILPCTVGNSVIRGSREKR
jgi:hypothetical protein